MVFVYQLPGSGITCFAMISSRYELSECARSDYIAVSQAAPEVQRGAPTLEVVKITISEISKRWCTETVWSTTTDRSWWSPAASITLYSGGSVDFCASIRAGEKLSMWQWSRKKPASMSGSAGSSEIALSGTVPAVPDLVSTAESLASTPIADFSCENRASSILERLHSCFAAIGNHEDETRCMLEHLSALVRRVRSHTTVQESGDSISEGLLEWCNRIDNTSYKWTTFQLLHSAIGDVTSGSRLRDQWDSFTIADPLRMLEGYLKKGAMRSAMIVWNRHADERLICEIPKLLHFLPSSLPSASFEKWIQREVAPAIVKHCKESPQLGCSDSPSRLLHELAQWILDRARIAAENGSLSTALRLSRLLKSATRQNSASSSYVGLRLEGSGVGCFNQEQVEYISNDVKMMRTSQNAFEHLEELASNLHHIQHLADVHQFKISFQMFLEETSTTIAMSMMDRALSPDTLCGDIEHHVKSYLIFCKIPADKVLKEYVSEIAESIHIPHSAEKEARGIAVLNAIESIDVRADAALALFRSIAPPYSDLLKEYARKHALAWETDRHVEIQEHFRLMEIQDMLMAYGVKQFSVADGRNASRLLGHILGQFARPSALDDAMRLVDAYSHLHCDRAAVQFIENLLSSPPVGDGDTSGIDAEICRRAAQALDALTRVKQRNDVVASMMLLVSVMEEAVEFGMTLLEREEQQSNSDPDRLSPDLESFLSARILEEDPPRSFVLQMLTALVSTFVLEIQTLHEYAVSARDEEVLAYVVSPDFVLTDTLLRDLRTLGRIERDHQVLLSISTLRDPERVEAKVKRLLKPGMLFGGDRRDEDEMPDRERSVAFARGKGKKRAAAQSDKEGVNSESFMKKPRLDREAVAASSKSYTEDQQDEHRAQYAASLARFAASVRISRRKYRSMTAQLAARNGYVLPAVRFARDLFSRRLGTILQVNIDARTQAQPTGRPCASDSASDDVADTLRQISATISWYTATHIDEMYALSRTPCRLQSPLQRARTLSPTYSLELLRYAICVCEMDAFEETFVLMKNAALLDEVLHFTQLDVAGGEHTEDKRAQWRLFDRWFRGDACVLPASDAMRLATRFAIAEHKSVVSLDVPEDLIASKRYVSFLVENNADLLSLKALLSMRALPEDAISVIQSQVARLLSTVFQSQMIDSFFALGCVRLCAGGTIMAPVGAMVCFVITPHASAAVRAQPLA